MIPGFTITKKSNKIIRCYEIKNQNCSPISSLSSHNELSSWIEVTTNDFENMVKWGTLWTVG